MTEEELINLFSNKDQFAKLCGVVVDSASGGKATGHIDVAPEHLNAMFRIQGGALFTLADTVAAAAANSLGLPAVTLQSNIQFLRPAQASGRLTARAHVSADHHKLPAIEVRISDAQGLEVFLSTSIFYVKER